MAPVPIVLAGERLLLDAAGAVFWPARRSLIVADLHLEKASACAARGALLPPYDSRETLAALDRLARDYAPERIIALGNSFHDGAGAFRLSGHDRVTLERIMARTEFVWIAGNHDPLPPGAILPGLATGAFAEAGLKFRHVAAPRLPLPARHGELSGHFHPKARVATRGGTIARRCFVLDAHRLLLPALGAYSGGLDVTSAPIRTLFPLGASLFLLGAGRLFTFRLHHTHMEPA